MGEREWVGEGLVSKGVRKGGERKRVEAWKGMNRREEWGTSKPQTANIFANYYRVLM